MATESINDLYLKYTNKVGRSLETDRYFQYLFEMIQAGDNTLEQKYQVMHKVVDEAWLSIIEDTLDDINTIIDKPRRFIATKEEVVPVALARKITADSVRHLSQHTQYIASTENGDIQPTRVLNVSTEESFDLYENRFVYHLIQRLVTFIDKRTDVIFWSTGDETQNALKFESKVDDAYEEISYKIEMVIKNRQSFAENDADNMGLFMRIDRVRRMVMALKNSSFCDIMAGCAKVRSPIQRTNLIMKDPHYRACYKLWQFLEQYDSVGYSIEVQDSALEFDEEYLYQMYTNLITNYAVFKSLCEPDKRNLMEVLHTKRRKLKPKFIKKIKEVIVDDYDLEDVEIRQVIIEEVTQAQLDAEAKLAEETELRKQAEQNLAEMDDQMISLQQQVMNLTMMNQQAEMQAEDERVAKEEALAALENEKAERAAEAEQAAAELAKEKEERAAELAKEREERQAEAEQAAAELAREKEERAAELAKEREERRAEAEQAAAELAKEKEERAAELAKEKQECDALKGEKEALLQEQEALLQEQEALRGELAQAKAALEEARQAAAEERETLERQVISARQRAEEQTAEMQQKANEEIARAQAQARETVADMKRQTEAQIAETKQEAEQKVDAAEQKAKQQIAETKQEADRQITEAKQEADRRIADIRQSSGKQIEEARQSAEKQIADTRRDAEEQIAGISRDAKREVERITGENAGLKKQLDEAFVARENREEQIADLERELQEAREAAHKAQERADANTLSKYIIASLERRRHRGEKAVSDADEDKNEDK